MRMFNLIYRNWLTRRSNILSLLLFFAIFCCKHITPESQILEKGTGLGNNIDPKARAHAAAWFLNDKRPICTRIETDEGLPLSKEQLQKHVESSFNKWSTYVKDADASLPHDQRFASQLIWPQHQQWRELCPDTELTFYFGQADAFPEVKSMLTNYRQEKLVATWKLTNAKQKSQNGTYRQKGMIWLAGHIDALNQLQNAKSIVGLDYISHNSSEIVYALSHAWGAVFGTHQVPGTITANLDEAIACSRNDQNKNCQDKVRNVSIDQEHLLALGSPLANQMAVIRGCAMDSVPANLIINKDYSIEIKLVGDSAFLLTPAWSGEPRSQQLPPYEIFIRTHPEAPVHHWPRLNINGYSFHETNGGKVGHYMQLLVNNNNSVSKLPRRAELIFSCEQNRLTIFTSALMQDCTSTQKNPSAMNVKNALETWLQNCKK